MGRDVILLSSGDLDFETPPHVVEAANRAALNVPVGYTNVDGTVELKEAIRRKFARENGISCSLEQVLVGNGSKQIMFNALIATVTPGDEVIVPAPYWASYLDLAAFAEAAPVIARTSQASGWKLTPEGLERLITSRTRWLIINNPVNPTGGLYSAAELEALAVVLRRHPQVLVMSDDLYEHVVYDGEVFATMASAAPDLAERTLTINGVSKTFAMMGWRIGYGAGPAPLIANMLKVQSQSTSSASTVSQAAAEAALDGPQDELVRRLAVLTAARDKVAKAVSAIPGLSMQIPRGTFYAYISCEELLRPKGSTARSLTSDRDVASFLLDEGNVVVLPGGDCGLSPFFRINFACPPKLLDEALARIGSAVSRLL
jgi:aspartate aminotransferase